MTCPSRTLRGRVFGQQGTGGRRETGCGWNYYYCYYYYCYWLSGWGGGEGWGLNTVGLATGLWFNGWRMAWGCAGRDHRRRIRIVEAGLCGSRCPSPRDEGPGDASCRSNPDRAQRPGPRDEAVPGLTRGRTAENSSPGHIRGASAFPISRCCRCTSIGAPSAAMRTAASNACASRALHVDAAALVVGADGPRDLAFRDRAQDRRLRDAGDLGLVQRTSLRKQKLSPDASCGATFAYTPTRGASTVQPSAGWPSQVGPTAARAGERIVGGDGAPVLAQVGGGKRLQGDDAVALRGAPTSRVRLQLGERDAVEVTADERLPASPGSDGRVWLVLLRPPLLRERPHEGSRRR